MMEAPAIQRKLASRVLLFLTLALVPLGLAGMWQNQRLNAEYQERMELSLLALTAAAASGERQMIQRTFGAAEALGELIGWVLDDPERCRETLEGFRRSNASFAFVGFIGTDGVSNCSTADRELDFSNYPNFRDLLENPRRNIGINHFAPGSGQSVMIIIQPRFSEGVLQGYVSISLPLEDVGNAEDFQHEDDPVALVTLNHRGQVLSTERPRETELNLLPDESELASLLRGQSRVIAGESRSAQARVIAATSRSGQDMVYTIVPIIPDVAYALAAWDMTHPAEGTGLPRTMNAALPFLMWLTSFLVVWLVIDRLLIGRIQNLNMAMQRFAKNRTLPDPPRPGRRTTELSDLEQALHGMAQDILLDEARQEDKLREKTILLKEVHHRVKNNLQIISSIMNLQIRKARSEETKRALRQVQDRIMGLSGVHRTLYQANNLSQVDASHLIEQIVEQSRAIGTSDGASVDVVLALDPVTVYPDQAVPLTMLVSEAVTNAMKYIGGPAPQLSLSMVLQDESQVRLVIENTVAEDHVMTEDDATPIGLGKQLIRAFAAQLDGTAEMARNGDRYRVEVLFNVTPFSEEPLDY